MRVRCRFKLRSVVLARLAVALLRDALQIRLTCEPFGPRIAAWTHGPTILKWSNRQPLARPVLPSRFTPRVGGGRRAQSASLAHHPWLDYTSDLRMAVSAHASRAGLPSFGHGWPFMLTQNWRLRVNGIRASLNLRFLLQ